MSVQADLPAVPIAAEVEPEGRQALFWQGEAQIASCDHKAALRRRERAVDTRFKAQGAAGLAMPGKARERAEIEIVPLELKRHGRSAPRCVAADLTVTISQRQPRHREVIAAR